MKIMIPILVILGLLIGGYWFFILHSPDVTTGILMHLGDSQADSGHYDAAIRYYEWARDLSPENGELSLKLAAVYRQAGNYTKTERTLVRAIQAAPDNPELYVMLSSVYVEQDKLLDAQRMLDNIANPDVQQEVNARRPAAPAVSPEGAYYNDYITISFSGDSSDATFYYTVDGSFPSLLGNAYTEPFVLEAGNTTVCAVAVDSEGLVSPAIYVGYTVAGVVEDVTFHDAALEQTIQDLLHRGNRTIQTDDLWGITELNLPTEITSTEDLVQFTGLVRLTGRDLNELDYSFLSDLYSLRYLELDHCALTTQNLEQIAACPNLEVLILSSCGLSNISPLESLSSLRVLDLTDNSINSISAISGLSALDELYLGHNALSSLPNMRELKSLRTLDLSYNALDSVTALSGCPTLQRLNVSHNKLVTVRAIGSLPALTFFNGSNNGVRDVSSLSGCKNLETFVMTDNKLTDVDFLSEIPTIRDVNIDYNDVVAVPAFVEDCPLERFSAAHNFLEDLSGLAGLPSLGYVNADYNNIRDISVLKTCPVLAQVNVYGTYIHSGGVLAEQGVQVFFTPAFD